MTKSFDRHPYLKHSTAEDMTFKPAHKDTQHPAGQVRPTDAELKGQQTLSDYIRSIKRAEAFDAITSEKKLTFSEWYTVWLKQLSQYKGFVNRDDMEHAWNAALKHGKGPSS